MEWSNIFSSAFVILFNVILFAIPYLISKWFVMDNYKPQAVLYKTTSNWDYIKGTIVAIVIGCMIFFGGSSSSDDLEQSSIRLTPEDAIAFFIVMALGGLIGVFVSHHRIGELNEKEYKEVKQRELLLTQNEEMRKNHYSKGYKDGGKDIMEMYGIKKNDDGN